MLVAGEARGEAAATERLLHNLWQKPGRGQGESEGAQLENFTRKQIMKGNPQCAAAEKDIPLKRSLAVNGEPYESDRTPVIGMGNRALLAVLSAFVATKLTDNQCELKPDCWPHWPGTESTVVLR